MGTQWEGGWAASATRPQYSAPAQTKTEHATQLRRVSFLFRPRHCPFRDSLSIPPRNSSLSLGGRAPRSPPLSDVDPAPRLGPPSLRPLSRRSAPEVLRDGVPALITQSVEIMYSNSLGGIQSHETGPKRRPQRPPFGNPPTHHNTPSHSNPPCDLGQCHPCTRGQALVVHLHCLEQDFLMPSEEDVDLGLCGPGLFFVLACRRVRPSPQRV